MRRFLAIFLGVVLALCFVPAFGSARPTLALGQSVPTVPAAHPEAVTGATPPANEATREKIYVKDFYDRDYSHYYGPADNMPTDDGTVLEAALNESSGKTLVLEAGKTYTFGSYVRSNAGGNLWRVQGIHLRVSDVVIEGNGATLKWDPDQPFVDGQHPVTYEMPKNADPVVMTALEMWKDDMRQVTGLVPVSS